LKVSRNGQLRFRYGVYAAGMLSLLLAAGWFGFRQDSAHELLTQAQRHFILGEYEQAEQLAAAALDIDETLSDAALQAAKCAEREQRYDQALAYLKRVDDAGYGDQANFQRHLSKLLHYDLNRLADADVAYRRALKREPDNNETLNGLARLLALCGRRREAIPFVLQLIRNDYETDLLILLARENSTLSDRRILERAQTADADDPNPLIGLAWLAAESGETEKAISLLRQASRCTRSVPYVWAVLGRQLAESSDLERLTNWERDVPPEADAFPEVWQVRGRLAERLGDHAGAIRCYWEALMRGPESEEATFRISYLLTKLGEVAAAEKFTRRLRELKDYRLVQTAALFSEQKGLKELLELAEKSLVVGRCWEALAWARVAWQIDESSTKGYSLLTTASQRVTQLPLELTDRVASPAASIDLSHFPLPKLIDDQLQPIVQQLAGRTRTIRFRDDTGSTGLDFRYENGAHGNAPHRMHQLTGGGLGVLDADMDGFPDVFCTQGGQGPFQNSDVPVDNLFRNIDGRRFVNSTVQAEIFGHGFGQGVSTGDFDANGFPDVYVANAGSNLLWLNLGDGTFKSSITKNLLEDESWTTSCMLADLNADGLPDLYDVNYLSGLDVYEKLCVGEDGMPVQCIPTEFESSADRIRINDGEGSLRDVDKSTERTISDGTGLGIAAWKDPEAQHLSAFVANDTTENFLLTFETEDGELKVSNLGIESGVAFNGQGKAEGCMGIALGDVDGNGLIDLHITNFLSESNTLYLQNAPGFFSDQTRECRLEKVTQRTLGFGTQLVDFDLNGRLELFVANGHVDDLSRFGKPYRMQPQLFHWVDGQFHETVSVQQDSYFRSEWIGRSVAVLDWNRDGRSDLIVGHLIDRTSLLTNITTDPGNFVSLRLIGRQSGRDAVGACAKAEFSSRTLVRHLTAGSGYHASNQRQLIIGTGSDDQIKRLEVHWPSGLIQGFDSVAADASYSLVEGGGALKKVD